MPPGFIPPGLAKKCGQVEEPYPDMHPGGPREGWEKQFKKKHWEFHYTNDVSLALPEPLQVTDKSQLSGSGDTYRWKQTYTYGAGGERLSMNYLPAYDANNGWDPLDGTAGAEPGVAPRTLYYLNDALGSAIGLIEKDGRVSSRYHYDEFGIPQDAKKFDVNWPGPDNLYGYTGLGYDFNSSLTYARARYYKPDIGRFISEDTYKGDMWYPLSLNLYTYTANNPLKYIDPSGHDYIFSQNQYNWLVNLSMGRSYIESANTPGNADWATGELTKGNYYIDTNNPNGGYVGFDKVPRRMSASEELEKFMTQYESFAATPYYASEKEKQQGKRTIGYGHVILPNENFTSITEGEALDLFRQDLGSRVSAMNYWAQGKGVFLSQNQFDALVDFAYHKGIPAFQNSDLAKDIASGASTNQIQARFLEWQKSGGKFSLGLWRRSYDEWEIFSSGDYTRNETRKP